MSACKDSTVYKCAHTSWLHGNDMRRIRSSVQAVDQTALHMMLKISTEHVHLTVLWHFHVASDPTLRKKMSAHCMHG